jgi:hypothetical protein
MRWSARWMRVGWRAGGVNVTVGRGGRRIRRLDWVHGLLPLMLVPFRPFGKLVLQHSPRDSCGVVEYQSATIQARGENRTHAAQRQSQYERAFEAYHAAFTSYAPHRHDSEDPHADEAKRLMRLHYPVHGISVGYEVLRLESRDYRGHPSEDADQKGPETHLPKDRSSGGHRDQLEEDRGHQQCDG